MATDAYKTGLYVPQTSKTKFATGEPTAYPIVLAETKIPNIFAYEICPNNSPEISGNMIVSNGNAKALITLYPNANH